MSIMILYNITQTHVGEILERMVMMQKKKLWHDPHHVLCGAVWQRPLRQAALAVVSYCHNQEDTSSSDTGDEKAAATATASSSPNVPVCDCDSSV